eukprot:CAMPEP_0172596768 /NCGR_PEP_ID=MMETSP1068-20121228/16610_1 /TAXON_ID=35684 /ORGANISM="Pseudopedinella elastica, Strain CCMP716" /LENGTH=185 /DNA_ID=CAMNT_0013395959 /DNA_START=65 /DNA_END=625 /DNA_ORIENTATION=-
MKLIIFALQLGFAYSWVSLSPRTRLSPSALKAADVYDGEISRRSFSTILSTGVLAPLAVSAEESTAPAEITTESGLKIIDLKVGTGAQPTPGQTVKVDYTGWLNDFDDLDGKFDSSKDRRKPLSFAVGTGRVIAGWDEGVLGMKIGGKRRMIIPSELGYGKRGAGGIIPPGATLYFEVELLGITP